MSIRVLIVDDQILFSRSLRVVLGADPENGIEVVGITSNGEEAINATKTVNPDIILMDVRMPVMDGVEATKRIHRESPNVKIVMLTTFDDDVYVRDAISGGAVGYLMKDIEPEDLCTAIHAAYAGTFLFSPTIGIRLGQPQSLEADGKIDIVRRISMDFSELTYREAEVLALLIKSFDNFEIAYQLGIAKQTVKNYTSSIYMKLGVKDRLHAMRYTASVLKNRTC